uniref:Uncharacterized protein n=1 Tax=Anopheles atroparvus TaxID=41427 RepID=A0A182IJ01_ANOAO
MQKRERAGVSKRARISFTDTFGSIGSSMMVSMRPTDPELAMLLRRFFSDDEDDDESEPEPEPLLVRVPLLLTAALALLESTSDDDDDDDDDAAEADVAGDDGHEDRGEVAWKCGPDPVDGAVLVIVRGSVVPPPVAAVGVLALFVRLLQERLDDWPVQWLHVLHVVQIAPPVHVDPDLPGNATDLGDRVRVRQALQLVVVFLPVVVVVVVGSVPPRLMGPGGLVKVGPSQLGRLHQTVDRGRSVEVLLVLVLPLVGPATCARVARIDGPGPGTTAIVVHHLVGRLKENSTISPPANVDRVGRNKKLALGAFK